VDVASDAVSHGPVAMVAKLALAAFLGALAGTLVATGSQWVQPDQRGSGALSSHDSRANAQLEAAWQLAQHRRR
jgi:hypothetical protein